MKNLEVVKQELERLSDINDGLKPSDVVESAKAKDSPLHGCFQWDNAKAGHGFRLWQARQLIASVKVAITRSDGGTMDVRAFTRTGSGKPEEQTYHPTVQVVQDPDLYQKALAFAMEKLRAAEDSVLKLKAIAANRSESDVAKILLAVEALATARAALVN